MIYLLNSKRDFKFKFAIKSKKQTLNVSFNLTHSPVL